MMAFSYQVLDRLSNNALDVIDLLDDGKFTQHSPEETKENVLISILNLVLMISIWQIFSLRWAICKKQGVTESLRVALGTGSLRSRPPMAPPRAA